MRVAIATSYPLADTNASTERLRAFCSVLSSDHYVTIFAPDGHDIPHTSHVSLNYLPDTSTFVRRSVSEIRYLLILVKHLKKHDLDLIIASCPSIFLMFLPLFGRIPTIVDFRDLTWEYLPSSRRYRPLKYLFRMASRLAANLADGISVTNDAELQYFREMSSVVGNKTILIRNGISQERFNIVSTLKAPPITRARGRVKVLFCGNIAKGRGLDALVSALGSNPAFEVNIVGGGNFLNELRETVDEKRYDNIKFWGPVPWNEVVSHYKQNHVLFASLSGNFDGAMPSKLYEYLALDHPLVFGGSGLARDFVSRFSATYPVAPDCASDVAVALARIIRNPTFRTPDDKAYIESNFIRELESKKLADLALRLAPK